MPYENKIHLPTVKDRNGWYMFARGKYRLQLCGNSALGWFWLKQYADKLGKHEFMKDFTEILALMEQDSQAPFTLYELTPVAKWKQTSDTHSRHNPQSSSLIKTPSNQPLR